MLFYLHNKMKLIFSYNLIKQKDNRKKQKSYNSFNRNFSYDIYMFGLGLVWLYIIFIVGHGSMGISNSIGSNTFDILLCLGLPWLIKASLLPTIEGQHFVGINSRGLEYSAISLLSTLLLLYATFSCNKFQLDRKVGQACLIMYMMFLVLASLIELNVFFLVNLPTCGRWTVITVTFLLWRIYKRTVGIVCLTFTSHHYITFKWGQGECLFKKKNGVKYNLWFKVTI